MAQVYSGQEAVTQIFAIMLNNFLKLNSLKLNGAVIPKGEDNTIDISPSASDIAYERDDIGDVEGALDYLFENQGSTTAEGTSYDNAVSGLTATNVQAAIDELKTMIDGLTPGGDIPDAEGEAF